MKGQFLLHCDIRQSVFTLAKDGEEWRRRFGDLSAALEYAGSLVTEPTKITFYNDHGGAVTESVVIPNDKKG